MSEMIERVAKAISLGEWSDSEHWQCRSDREEWMERARSAIEAMRQPTEAMDRAGLRENTLQGAAIWATPAWQAMIDMALVP